MRARKSAGPGIHGVVTPLGGAPRLAEGPVVDVGIWPHRGASLVEGAGAGKERAAVDVPEISAQRRQRFPVVGTDDWLRCRCRRRRETERGF
jgi:hypothetical protein